MASPALRVEEAFLRAGESRLSLLHEGLAAFGIIAAGEAFRHQVGAFFQVALGARLDHLADDEFDRVDRQRRISTDGFGVILDVALKLIPRQRAIDQPHGDRFGRAKLTRGVETVSYTHLRAHETDSYLV